MKLYSLAMSLIDGDKGNVESKDRILTRTNVSKCVHDPCNGSCPISFSRYSLLFTRLYGDGFTLFRFPLFVSSFSVGTGSSVVLLWQL